MRIIITTDVKSEVLISEGMLNVINPVKVEFEEMRRPKPDIPEIRTVCRRLRQMKKISRQFRKRPKPYPPSKNRKPPVKPKIQLDMGKVFALWNANWTYAQIAEEMGVSVPTVKRRMQEWEPPEEGPEEEEL